MKKQTRSHVALVVVVALMMLWSTGCYTVLPSQPAPVQPGPAPVNGQAPVQGQTQGEGPVQGQPPMQGPQAPAPQGPNAGNPPPQGPIPGNPPPQGPVPGNPPSAITSPDPNQIPGQGPQQGQPGNPGQPAPQPPSPVPSGSQQSGCAGAPVIPFFTANPTSITAGQSVTLSWGNVTNGTTGPWVRSTTIQPGLGEVGSGASSRDVKPTSTTTYTLTATGCGGTATKQVTVTVNNANAALPTVGVLKTDLQATDMYKDEGNLIHIGIRNNSSNSGNMGFGVSCTGEYQAGTSAPKTKLSYSAPSLNFPFNANQERWTNTNIKLDKGTGYYTLTCTISAPSDSNTSNNSVTKTLTITP